MSSTRDAGKRAVGLPDDDELDAAVLELSRDQHGLAASRMEPIVDPPFNHMFVGSMSPFRMILAARVAASLGPASSACWLRSAKPAWAPCSRSRRRDWHATAVTGTR